MEWSEIKEIPELDEDRDEGEIVPWTEVRPGVLSCVRRVRPTLEHPSTSLRQWKHRCQDCEGDPYPVFMVRPVLWSSIMNTVGAFEGGGGLICPSCFEKRLGRPLQEKDLTDCPANTDFLASDFFG